MTIRVTAVVIFVCAAWPAATASSSPWSALARRIDIAHASRDAHAHGSVPPEDRTFVIHGWHWHALAVQSHLGRLAHALGTEPLPSSADVRVAWGYLWDFSASSLRRIEERVLLPWLSRVLPAEHTGAISRLSELSASAFASGSKVAADVRALSSSTEPLSRATAARLRTECLALRQELRQQHQHALSLAVPLVAANVPREEQEAFNHAVLRTIGIGSSRLHLVEMADVVASTAARGPPFLRWRLGAGGGGAGGDSTGGARLGWGLDGDQRACFRERIPWVARSMLGRWRRLLFEPRAGPILCSATP